MLDGHKRLLVCHFQAQCLVMHQEQDSPMCDFRLIMLLCVISRALHSSGTIGLLDLAEAWHPAIVC